MRKVTPNQIAAYRMRYFRKSLGWSADKACEELARNGGPSWQPATWWSAEGSWNPGARIRVFDADLLAALARTFDVGIFDLLVPPTDQEVLIALKENEAQETTWAPDFWVQCLGSATGDDRVLDFRQLIQADPELKETFTKLAKTVKGLTRRLEIENETRKQVMERFQQENLDEEEKS